MVNHNNRCPACDSKVKKAYVFEFKLYREKKNTHRPIGWYCLECLVMYELNRF